MFTLKYLFPNAKYLSYMVFMQMNTMSAHFFGTLTAKISFFTAIPILSIISLYNLQKILIQNDTETSIFNIVGIVTSFIFSYITIKFFLIFLKKFSLLIFVIYRIILGIIILIYVYI